MAIKLLTVRNDIQMRFKDIQTMLSTLDENTSVCCQVVLKSSLMLMLYNVVEGTFSNLLTELFDTIVRKKISIENLPGKLQNTIYTYYLKKIGSDIKKLKEFNGCDKIQLCNISYLDINKYLKLFSGNLDSKSIRKVSEKLGINLPEGIDEPELLSVKNVRNRLAHGESRFSNACQDMTLKEIKSLCTKVKVYLENVIVEYENFFERLR